MIFLVALDGSEAALRALARARNESVKLSGCSLHLLTVHIPWIYDSASEADLERVSRLAQVYHDWVVGQARVILDPDGPTYACESVEGDPVDRILEKATELGCAAIYIGAHGMGFSRGSSPGSTATRVRQLSPIPVHVIE
jgi:nucleotide-binding universal stress UspA family protein